MKLEKIFLVSVKEEIIIKDSCILIDMVDLGLLKDFFQLDLSVFTTINVINEITNELQWTEIKVYVDNKELQVDGDADYDEITSIKRENPGLSLADSSVLELGLRKDAVILSADGTLRKVSEKKNLKVRGALWVIQELCDKTIINLETALTKLELYRQVNKRVPLAEIEKLIKKLNETSDN